MKRKLIFPIIIFVLSLCFILIFSFLGNKPRIANLGNIQFIEKNNNTYKYSLKLMEKDTIFKHSDLFYIYLNEKNLPDYIKEIIPIKKGHPNIQIISSEKLDTNKEYEAEYILKLKDEVYIISLMLCYLSILLIIIFYIKNINKRIILLYLSLLLLIIVNTFLSKLQLNYIEIFLLISFYILIILNDNNFQFFNLKIKHKNLLLVSTALFTAFANVFIINFSYPNVGEDISMILPRAYSLLTYAKNNGIFNIEFASPLFGAGLISYPNPQYDQFSIFYFLRYIMPFWKAYLLCVFLFSIIGFISFYYFNKDVLKVDFKTSLMSAVLFSFTGYYIHHIMIGHWTFLYHPLTALIVYLSFSDKLNYFIRILINALIFSAMIFGGAMQTIFFYTCFTLLGIAAILFKPNKKFIVQCLSIIFSCFLGIILSLSKFVQSVYFGALIDRGHYGLHSNNPILLLRNILSTLSYSLQALISFSKDSFGLIWEYDLALPIISIILLVFMIIYYILNSSKNEKKEFISKYKFNIILLLIFIYLYCDIFFANGIIRSLFSKLRSVNLHLRMASTLIIPFLMIFALIFNRFNVWSKNKKHVIILFIAILAIVFYSHRFISIQTINTNYAETNIDFDDKVFYSIKSNHDKYKVTYINNKLEIYNMIDFTNNTAYELNTSRLPYESIYGYGLETFKAKEEGSPYEIVNNKYNFTDPRSLIFFNNNFPQFSGFNTNDIDKLNNFLSFKEVKWEEPKYFTLSNYISALSHIIVISILILYFIYKLLKNIIMHHKNNTI
ncbi:hypothetical protein R4L22_05425 [Brachyspira pilosicoli]|uniref:hypothetical protein n=1 Tax=Brachyspira pilosicoli TaxID=52584 RepID=UPI0012F4DDD6|nr:hypothetical protein [Brachyspira pilosicoli]